MPKISVVSAYYNRAGQLLESIPSILSQSFTDFEYIIVDDGSTDNTLEILHGFKDDRLRILSQGNRGLTVAINRAIRESRGEYIAVQGAGDISLPLRLERQAAALDEKPETGIVGCYVRDQFDHQEGAKILMSENGLPFFETLLQRNIFTHGEVMYRRSLFDAVGGYRELFQFAQDRDLWLRMSRRAGYWIVPEVLYDRLKPPGSVSKSPLKLMRQYKLSNLAVQSAQDIDGEGRDLIDRYGDRAPEFKKPSAFLADRLAWLGIWEITHGKPEDGWTILNAARREKITPYVAKTFAAGSTYLIPPLWQITRPRLARYLMGKRSSPE